MLDSIRKASEQLGRELSRAWDNLSEGWRDLVARGGHALTHFRRDEQTAAAVPGEFPRWSLLAGEVEETSKELVVRLEVPGCEREDLEIQVDGNLLVIRGEKRWGRDEEDSGWHVMERAYGAFSRSIPLPRPVETDAAKASLKNGVLTVRLPKTAAARASQIAVQ